MSWNLEKVGYYFLRYALAGSFLSAVADRLGFWGNVGTPGVVWGNFQSFTEYTGSLLFYFPSSLFPVFAWSATVLEIVLGLLLIIGYKLKYTAIASSVLLASFGLAMAIAYGIKAPFDYSVFTACAASLFLAYSHPQDIKKND